MRTSEIRKTEMRELSAVIVRAVKEFYENEENRRLFEAWHDKRSTKHEEKEAKEAC